MFESDDYDQILSQFDFPNLPGGTENETKKSEQEDLITNNSLETILNVAKNIECDTNSLRNNSNILSPLPKNNLNTQVNSTSFLIPKTKEFPQKCDTIEQINCMNKISPKHTKRKIIDTHFDYNTKRKFPGPAGLLTGNLQESHDESVGHLELFSQDIDFSENSLKRGLFELPIWSKLKENISSWNLSDVDTIKGIKQQALAGNLRRRKAQTVTAFIETVDRSVTDPLIVLRDTTGNIKCTLHRDAWSLFSPYLVAEHCALVLWKPTVLTTGSAYKKHYLNITLSNIYAIFSSAVLQDETEVTIPDEYLKDCENNITIIRIKESPDSLGSLPADNNESTSNEQNLLDDLDSIFSDDIF